MNKNVLESKSPTFGKLEKIKFVAPRWKLFTKYLLGIKNNSRQKREKDFVFGIGVRRLPVSSQYPRDASCDDHHVMLV